MYSLLNIPPHTGCRGCGDCCGIIPATPTEIREIRKFLKDFPEIAKSADKRENKLHCPFLTEKKACAIYSVRPVICRLCGVTKGMDCRYGNSASISGELFLQSSDTSILNFLVWGEGHGY